jgi:cyclohexadieny/prephenate dehydrogenase
VIERLGAPLVEPIFDELAIVGVGLIGSSIARAARRRNAARRIVVADHSVAVLERAKALGLGDVVTDDPARAVRSADCVILCVRGLRGGRTRHRAGAEAGDDRLGRRVGQKRGDLRP